MNYKLNKGENIRGQGKFASFLDWKIGRDYLRYRYPVGICELLNF